MDLFKYDFSLEKQLKYLLRQQETIEERIIAQRASMREISDRFTVLRERATHSAHSELSLHDLLVVAAYGSTQRVAHMPETKDSATVHSNQPYAVLIRSRILDESCAEPDCATQFHSLTADSLYLLIPHLANVLSELAGKSRMPGVAAAFSSAPHRIPLSDAAAADVDSSAWVSRVLRFLELSVRYFPEVMENSEYLPQVQESLAKLWNQETAVMELRRRAGQLLQQIERRQTDEL